MSVRSVSLEIRRVTAMWLSRSTHESGDVFVHADMTVFGGFREDRSWRSADVRCWFALQARVPGVVVGPVGLLLLGELSRYHVSGRSRLRPNLVCIVRKKTYKLSATIIALCTFCWSIPSFVTRSISDLYARKGKYNQ